MSTFTLVEILEVKGKVKFKKLMIDGTCPFDVFCEQIRHEGNLAKQLKNVANIMDRVSNGHLLSRNKFKDITTRGDRIREYEIKTQDLRIYLFKVSENVVNGGKKGSQQKDIVKFRTIKQHYLNSIKK